MLNLNDYTHEIIEMSRGTTKHGNSMWICKTKQGDTLFVFADENELLPMPWRHSGYIDEMLEMQESDCLRWESHPIEVYATQNGRYFNIHDVKSKAVDAKPDKAIVPNYELYYPTIYSQLGWLLKEAVAIFDTETTGTNPKQDEIVSIAATDWASSIFDDVVVYVRPENPDKLLEPSGKENKSAYDVHGIHPDDLEDKPSFKQAYKKIEYALAYRHWVCWNTDFDVSLLDSLCLRHDLPLIPRLSVTCAMRLISPLFNEYNHKRQDFNFIKLETVASHFELDTSKAHNAFEDVVMTRGVMQAVYEQLKSL